MNIFTSSTMLLISTIICFACSAVADDGIVLTHKETIKMLYAKRRAPVSAICRANPEVKKELLEILENRPDKANIPLVIQTLGYIGGSSEAILLDSLLEKILVSEPAKELTRQQKDEFYAISLALGFMSYRGISQAKSIVEKRIADTDWVAFGKRWYHGHGSAKKPSTMDQVVAMFLLGYAVSQDPDLEKMAASLKDKFGKDLDKSAFWISNPEKIKKIGLSYRKMEKRAIPAEFLSFLKGEKISPPSANTKGNASTSQVDLPESEYLKQVLNEATNAFSEIANVMLDDNSAELVECMKLRERILDNGKPISLKKWTRSRRELVKVLGLEKAILEDVQKAGLDKYENFTLKIDAEVQCQNVGKSQVVGREIIIVTFVISKSAAIYKKHMPIVGSSKWVSTKDEKGNLRVYMKKTNGKWAWNPFGW